MMLFRMNNYAGGKKIMTLDELSKAVGVPLKLRDTQKLIEETNAHLLKQEARKQQVKAKDKGEVISEAEAIERFYQDARRMD